jgi:two-component system NarL family sensor kinase
VPALRTWADGFSERTGITMDLKLEERQSRLAPDVETTLFRITQEALANVHRHSKSSSASVKLTILENTVELTISDKGSGFDAKRIFSGEQSVQLGVGLPGMRERARQLGGSFKVKSTGKGTSILVVLPRKEKDV